MKYLEIYCESPDGDWSPVPDWVINPDQILYMEQDGADTIIVLSNGEKLNASGNRIQEVIDELEELD